MLQMSEYYELEFKKKIVRLHLEEGRTLKGLAEEYGVSKASISKGYNISRLTVHKYMNTEMQLFSISRKKENNI